MKNYIICVIFIIFISCVLWSCCTVKPLGNKVFFNKDSLRVNSLAFLQDSFCVYTQEFLLDIDEKYRKTEIKCVYKINKGSIYLKTIECPSFLEGQSCVILPDSIREIYVSKFVTNIFPPSNQIFQAYSYGYINGIKNIDTLLYIKNGIYYAKEMECYYPGNYVPVGEFFSESGNERLTDKQKKRLFRFRKVPYNRE